MEAVDAARNGKPFPSPCQLRVCVSLHHDLARHLWVDRAVVGIRSRLGKRIGEFFIRIQHLGLEHTLRADRRMRDVITVCPGNRRSNGYRERLRPKNEIIDFHRRDSRGRVVIGPDAGLSRCQQNHRDHYRRGQTCNPHIFPFHCPVPFLDVMFLLDVLCLYRALGIYQGLSQLPPSAASIARSRRARSPEW